MASASARFLCPGHRRWLQGKPDRALSSWRSGFERAQAFMAVGYWEKAWRHAGCAYEAAQLMVQDALCCDRAWISRHAASVAQLSMLSAQLATVSRERCFAGAAIQ